MVGEYFQPGDLGVWGRAEQKRVCGVEGREALGILGPVVIISWPS